jgi:hypothetical protein
VFSSRSSSRRLRRPKNPIAHFAALARSVMVRGAGLEVAYLPLLVLVLIRGQLS